MEEFCGGGWMVLAIVLAIVLAYGLIRFRNGGGNGDTHIR